MTNPAQIRDRLKQPPPAPEASPLGLDAAVAEVAAAALDGVYDEQEAPLQDDRANEVYKFDFRFQDRRGRVYAGQFANKVLSFEEQRKAAQIEARLNGFVTYAAVPPLQGMLNQALAWLSLSLLPEPRPKWATKLDELPPNPDLVQALFVEVLGHQRYFCGQDDGSGAGA